MLPAAQELPRLAQRLGAGGWSGVLACAASRRAAAHPRQRLPADARGLIISNVDRTSDAATKGIQANDVLLRAGDRLLATPADLSAVVDQARRAGRPSVLVAVWRGGRTIFLPVKIAD